MVDDLLTPARKRIILGTCCLSLLIVSMDVTILNVALPDVRRELHASVSGLQWVIDIYTLVVASLLMLSGGIADRFGRRRVFLIGLVVFALGSALCSVAGSIGMLIGARFIQAIGGSMLNPVAMSIITQVFTGKAERARAVGVWGAVVGISMALGPIVGGVLIDSLGWKSVFWINLPICAVAVALTVLVVPESKSGTARRFDPIGQLLGIAFIATVVAGLIEGPGMGWTNPRTLLLFGIGAIAFFAFIGWEQRHTTPFIDLQFFRSAPFSTATVVAMLAFATYGAFFFLISTYLQTVRGYSAITAGLMYLPVAVATLLLSPISGRIVGRSGTRKPLIAAGTLLSAASVALTFLAPTTPIWQVLVTFALLGSGFAIVNAPITTSAVSGMPRDRAGAAAAVASTSRQLGVSIGVAISGSIAGQSINASGSTFTNAISPLWTVTCAFGLCIVCLAIISTTAWGESTTARIAHLFAEEREVEASSR